MTNWGGDPVRKPEVEGKSRQRGWRNFKIRKKFGQWHQGKGNDMKGTWLTGDSPEGMGVTHRDLWQEWRKLRNRADRRDHVFLPKRTSLRKIEINWWAERKMWQEKEKQEKSINSHKNKSYGMRDKGGDMTLQKRKKKRLSVPSSERMTGRGKGKVEGGREGRDGESQSVSPVGGT